jgi:hypothetical protein
MNNQEQGTQSPMELPTPVQSQSVESSSPLNNGSEKLAAQNLEQGLSAVAPVLVPTNQPQTDLNTIQDPTSLGSSSGSIADDSTYRVSTIVAEDSDLIEKEWVDKAKHIVEQTKHDPHLQNREMNNIKADYLKQRYNKDVKLSE